MAKNASEVAKKWARNLSQSTDSIKAGVQSVTKAPTAAAAERADAYLSGVQQAVATGKWQRGLRRTSLEDWRRSMTEKGIARIASGATQAQPKMESFLQEFLPYVEQGQQKLASMPRGDLQTNIARAVAMMEHNANFSRRG